MNSERIIFHIDVNNAFLSWESVYRMKYQTGETDLRTIPSAIGGDRKKRHGIILAKSEPAKTFGIKTAETLADALRKCPQLIIVPPRLDFYENCSSAFLKILSEYSSVIEKYSIDEAFLDMSESILLFGSPLETANLIKNRIFHELGFTVNIGIAPNKLLAKMASDFKKPNLVHTLYPIEIPQKMWPLPISNLFFVGKATKKKLNTIGIFTIGQLAHSDPDILVSHLGKHGQLIFNYANGTDSEPVSSAPSAYKGYSRSITISHDVTDKTEAKKILLSLCESVCSRLRQDHVMICVVSVSIKNCLLACGSHQKTLLSPTNVVSELHHHICMLFDEFWDGMPIRQLGIHTSKVTKENCRQLTIFDMDFYIRQEKLEKTLDQIHSKFGNDAVKRASLLDK